MTIQKKRIKDFEDNGDNGGDYYSCFTKDPAEAVTNEEV